MAIRISCPSCDASLVFNDDKRGKKVRCKKCEESFTLGGTNGKLKSTKSEAADDDDDGGAQPKKKKKPAAKKGNGLIYAIGGIAALIVLGLIGVAGLGAWWFFGKKAEEPNVRHVAAPEPKKEEPKKEEPVVPPPPQPDPTPEPKTGPPPLPPELEKVKQATVFISAQMPNGRKYEGTGFLADEDGVVITNAHVLGMLDAGAMTPTKITVTLYPGAPNQTDVNATPLGLDRDLDLVAVRISAPTLPAFLILEDSGKLAESQPVHVACFPYEAKVRKDFVIVPTAIAKLQRGMAGKLDAVRVGAGVSKANSGGPVVTAAGRVVGVAGNDEQTRQATSGDIIKRFLNGKVGKGSIGNVIQAGKDAKVNASYPLSDPLKRIQDVRVEVWTGGPGPDRPASYTPPGKLPGDGERKMLPLNQQKNSASADVPLPANVPSGQVVWLQPVVTFKDNSMQWGIASSVTPPPPSPYDLRPANLTVKMQSPKERTAKIDATYSTTVKKTTTSAHFLVDVLESMGPDPDGNQMKTAYGNLTNTDGTNTATMKPVLDAVHQIPNTYVLDNTNKLTKRVQRLIDGKMLKDTKDQAAALEAQIGLALEAGIVPMPNRTVQPGETWSTNYGILMRSKTKSAEGTLALTSTYQGFLKRNNRDEAIVTVTGKLTFPNNPDFKWAEGNVTGKIGFDDQNGFISSTQLKISNPDNSNKDNFSLDLDIQRSSGNTGNIQLVQDKPAEPKNDGKGKIIFDQKGNIVAGGNFDPALSTIMGKTKKLAYKQDLQVQQMMQANKTYTIQVQAMGFQPYIKLVTPNGVIPQAGSKLVYRAMAATQFSISVISHDGKVGAFHVTVHESP